MEHLTDVQQQKKAATDSLSDRSDQTSPLAGERAAIRAGFFIPGFATAIWAPLVPYAKLRAGMDEATLGLVLLCMGAGSLIAMPVAGAWAVRAGCRRPLQFAVAATALSLPLLALLGDPVGLCAALFLFGAGIGATDCVINIHGVAFERESGKPAMSGFHAFYSIGGVAGAVGATLVLSLGASPLVATLLALAIVVALWAGYAGQWRAERSAATDSAAPVKPSRWVILLGGLAFIVFLAEGSMLDWSAVFLVEVRDHPESSAGLGYVCFAVAMSAMRLAGNALVARIGSVQVVVAGASVGAAGLFLATLASDLALVLAGYTLVGLGCANIGPALFSLGGRLAPDRAAQAVTQISTLGYLGILGGPAAIGFIAQASSLATAFIAVAAALLVVSLGALALHRKADACG